MWTVLDDKSEEVMREAWTEGEQKTEGRGERWNRVSIRSKSYQESEKNKKPTRTHLRLQEEE